MLFAAFENNFQFIIFLILMVVGTSKICTVLKTNGTLRKSIWSIIFRK